MASTANALACDLLRRLEAAIKNWIVIVVGPTSLFTAMFTADTFVHAVNVFVHTSERPHRRSLARQAPPAGPLHTG